MGTILLIYVAVQLVTTAYGISVIESVRPIVNKKLLDDGYVLKNKNSMYKFNDKLENVLKGFIPFYYATKAISLIKNGNPVEKAYNKEIEEGNYITASELKLEEEEKARIELAKKFSHVKVQLEPSVLFEKPEKYVARRNDFDLLKSNEEDVKYDVIKEDNEERIYITPFKKVERTEPVEEIKPASKKEVVKAIMDLSSEELDLLDQKIQELSRVKRKSKSLVLDVA